MVGEPKYVPAEIYWILAEVLKKTKPEVIMSGYLELFHKTLNPTQIRYVKNKYGKDPDYNAPMINKTLKWKGDPQEIVPGYRRKRGYQSAQGDQPVGNMPTVAGPSNAISPSNIYHDPRRLMLNTSPYVQPTPANLMDQDYSSQNVAGGFLFQGFSSAQAAYMGQGRSETPRAPSISSQQDYMSPGTCASGPSPYQYLNMPVTARHSMVSTQHQLHHQQQQQNLPQYSQSAPTSGVLQTPHARRYSIPAPTRQASPHGVLDPHLFATYESPDEPERPAKRTRVSESTYRHVEEQRFAPIARGQIPGVRRTPVAQHTVSQMASPMRRASISDSPAAPTTPRDSNLAVAATPAEPQSQRRISREPATPADAHAHFFSPSRRLRGGIYNPTPSPYVSSLRQGTPRIVPQVMPYQSPAMPTFSVGNFAAPVYDYNSGYQQLRSSYPGRRTGGGAQGGTYVVASPARGGPMTPGTQTYPSPAYRGAYPSPRHLRRSQNRAGHALQQSPTNAQVIGSFNSTPILEQQGPSYIWETPGPQYQQSTLETPQMAAQSRAVRETRHVPFAIPQPVPTISPVPGSSDSSLVLQMPEVSPAAVPASIVKIEPVQCIDPALLSSSAEQGMLDEFGGNFSLEPGMVSGDFATDPLMAGMRPRNGPVPFVVEQDDFAAPEQVPVLEAIKEEACGELAAPIESSQVSPAFGPPQGDTSAELTFQNVLQTPETTLLLENNNAAPVEKGVDDNALWLQHLLPLNEAD